ncbi:MAG: hypothetical protein AAGE94_19365 [Acidobacteriota bacterium]
MTRHTLVIWLLVGLVGLPEVVAAGAFSGSDSDLFGLDAIVHPKGYDGTGGPLVLTVCLDPDAPDDAELPLQLAVAGWNARLSTTGNVAAGAIVGTSLDFWSWALHGVGLCLGLDDPVDDLGYAAATPGTNSMLDRGAGADMVAGSRDDVRGDDQNRVWFRIVDNDPFVVGGVVDSTTYTLDTAILPEGETFATVPTRAVAFLDSVAGTEAVMVASTAAGETKRSLVWDDIATVRLAEAGIDEIEGNADDYRVTLAYTGRSDTCDVPVSFAAQAEVVACVTGKGSLSGSHFRINFASLSFDESVSWHYGADGVLMVDGFETGNTDGWSSRVP